MTTAIDIMAGTCNLACWEAQEDACRCMCRGKNHGITRYGYKVPGRYMKRQGKAYQLVAVGDFSTVSKLVHSIIWPDGYPHGRCLFDEALRATPTPGQKKWPEIAHSGEPDPYLAWQRIREI